MKILSLYVKSFGKLANVNLEFHDGVNVISNVNGFGKTTMANFIRAMLYGLTYSRAKNALTDASRFAPWGSNDKFGGSMVVEHNGEVYRIERFFGKQAKSEELTVTNAKTNKRVNLSTEVGEFLLGLTADSFDRSAYFPQEAVELSTNDNLESRLANIVENSAEDYEKIQRNIRDYRRNLKLERGSGGIIYQLDCEKYDLQKQIAKAKSAEQRGVDIEKRLTQISVEKRKITEQQKTSKDNLEKLQHKYVKSALSDTEKESLEKLNSLESKLSRIPAEIEQDKQRCDELASSIATIRDDVKPRVYPNVVILVVSVILAVTGIVLCVALRNIVGYVVGAVLIALGIAGSVISFVRKGAKTLPSGEKDALVSEYYRIAGKYIYVTNLDYNEVTKKFWTFYGDYQGDKREAETLRQIVKRPSDDTSDLEEQIAMLQQSVENMNRRYTSLVGEEGGLVQERKTLSYDIVTPQERLLAVDNERKEALYRYDVAGKVSELLAEAKDRLSSSYLPRLCLRCQELLREVTERGYEVVIDRSFNVEIRENGQTKSMSSFSRGTREITLLCFRIALSELLYDGTIPFVIVDDAFVNFDENNFVRATNLLKKVAEQGQVIYFTCHKRVGNLLK